MNKKRATYAEERDFSVTSGPPARVAEGKGRSSIVQEHAARQSTGGAGTKGARGPKKENALGGAGMRGAPKKVKKKGAAPPVLAEFEPALATLVDRVPPEAGWIFELKLDGYRSLALIDHGEVRMVSRNGLDWSGRFPAIAEALRHLRVKNAVLDGELCFLEDSGKTSFKGLQSALSTGDQGRLAYFVFDILYRDGEDLRGRALLARKKVLATILAGERSPLKLSNHVENSGQALYDAACRLGLEGIIAKRADAPYTFGRTRAWLKVKCDKRQEFVIIGFTPPKGQRRGLGALVLGTHDPPEEGALRFVGKVGTGFSARSLADVHRRLKPLARATPPVPDAPRLRAVTWVEPELVCEVRFAEWTSDGALRHPSFLGLREDKPAEEVMREREEPLGTPGKLAKGVVRSPRATRASPS
jgi:bifunctional non-homologous end joining protein LigD